MNEADEAILRKAGALAGRIALYVFKFVCGIIGFIW